MRRFVLFVQRFDFYLMFLSLAGLWLLTSLWNPSLELIIAALMLAIATSGLYVGVIVNSEGLSKTISGGAAIAAVAIHGFSGGWLDGPAYFCLGVALATFINSVILKK